MNPVRITASSGTIDVTAERRGDVVIDRGQEHPMGGVLEVTGTLAGVVMRVPVGTDVVIGSASGAVKLHGELGEVRVTTRTGPIEVEACTSIDVRTMSGRVEIGTIAGDARIKTASGRVTVSRAEGELHVASVSGQIHIVDAAGPVRATTVNGTVEVAMTRAADARADSVSGSVRIALPDGVHPKASLVSLSGGCSCEVVQGDDCCVTGRTVSGRITIVER